MNSRQRLQAALNHQQPTMSRSTSGHAVSGHARQQRIQAAQALKLDPPGKPVKVVEPTRCSAKSPRPAGRSGRGYGGFGSPFTMFGFENKDWRPWALFDGTPGAWCLRASTPIPNRMATSSCIRRAISRSLPAAECPMAATIFDSTRRQEPIDESKLNPEDKRRRVYPISDSLLQYYTTQGRPALSKTDRAPSWPTSAERLRRYCLVPGPWMKHPKGIRDVAEWYMTTAARVDYVKYIFERQCQIGLQNQAKIYDAVGNKLSVIMVSGTDFRHAKRPFISLASYRNLFKPITAESTTGSTSTHRGRPSFIPVDPWSISCPT